MCLEKVTFLLKSCFKLGNCPSIRCLKESFSFSLISHAIFEVENLSWKLILREEKLGRKMIFQKIYFNINICKNVNLVCRCIGLRGISINLYALFKLSLYGFCPWNIPRLKDYLCEEKIKFKCWLIMFTHDSKELSNAY